jgi:hypothetical protein
MGEKFTWLFRLARACRSVTPRPALIKAVVKGHAWHRKVLDGEVADMRSLALQVGLTPHYVRNVFTCAFLAPDIVEAILEGRQPLALKFAHLYK